MLLPQSSAFALLKNRLNSVSAIGYLHIAPRAYDPPSSLQGKSSTNTAPPGLRSSTAYERPTRLKGRGDEIKWIELLEKFKAVQDKARRQQMQYNNVKTSVNQGSMANGGGGGSGANGRGGATASILSPSRTSTPTGSATNAAGTNAPRAGRGGAGGGGGGGGLAIGRLASGRRARNKP